MVNIVKFAKGDHVVYPTHGIGLVEAIEKQTVAGHELTLYSIFFKKDKMKMSVPVNKASSFGIRKLVSKDTIEKVFNVFKQNSKVVRGMWSRRAQEYEAKMYSGNIILTAEVVRDLFKGVNDPNRSYSERVIFENAFSRIIIETALVLEISEEETEKKITAILQETFRLYNNTSDQNEDEDFDEDEENSNAKFVA